MSVSQNWSISDAVRALVELDPYIIDSISKKYANLSALARLLKPSVENMLRRTVETDAIISSLKRLRVKQSELSFPVAKIIAASRLNLRSDLEKLTIKRTLKARFIVKEVTYNYRRAFLQVLEGISSITLIYDEKLRGKLKKLFPRRYVIAESSGLVALIIVSPIEITNIPGPLALMLNQLRSKHINVEEIISCNTDTLIIIKAEDGGKAFDSIRELIQLCRSIVISKDTA